MQKAAAYLWAKYLAQTLVANGVTRFCISPGFRDAPLALALHRLAEKNKKIQMQSIVDERACGYYALGRIRSSGEPTAIICTSGTAAANFFPAVMEAAHSRLPLIVITADRPEEMHHIGANQTTAQNNIFSQHIKKSISLSTEQESVPYHWLNPLADAWADSIGQGWPIHINISFSEPLLPTPAEVEGLDDVAVSELKFSAGEKTRRNQEVLRLGEEIAASSRPVFLVGPNQWTNLEKEKFYFWANFFKAIVWFEQVAALDLKKLPRGSSSKAWFYLEELLDYCQPDLIVQWGAPPTLRAFSRWRQKNKAKYILVDSWPENRDPTRSFNLKFNFSLSELSEVPPVAAAIHSGWTEKAVDWFVQLDSKSQKIAESLPKNAELAWSQALFQGLARGSRKNFFIGNSMPIRDFLQFSPAEFSELTEKIYTQRGLSGIDGNIATAAGILKEVPVPLVVVIGDLTAYHDLNSLFLLKQEKKKFLLIVINNMGGEIFRVVDTNQWREEENLFTTPVNIEWEKIAAAFAINFSRVSNLDSLAELVSAWDESGSQLLIELQINSSANREARQRLRQKT